MPANVERALALLGRSPRWWMQLLRRGARPSLVVYRKTRCRVPRSTASTILGQLHVGAPWGRGPLYAGHFLCHPSAQVHAAGVFHIHTGLRAHVGEGAVLVLGGGFISSHSTISCTERIEIGHGVAIADHVTIQDSDGHSTRGGGRERAAIRIGDRVWIGMHALILKGVTIGDGAVVAAGAVVTKDVPERSLVAGVPAAVIRTGVDWQ